MSELDRERQKLISRIQSRQKILKANGGKRFLDREILKEEIMYLVGRVDGIDFARKLNS